MPLDPNIRQQVLSRLTYGLYIMTTASDSEVAASTVTWLSQASFDPPRIMVAVKSDSRMHALVERTGAFAVHLVGLDQQDLAAAFFKPPQVGAGTLSGYPYEHGPETGMPILTDHPAWLEARVVESVTGGDHTVLVADIVNLGVRDAEMPPLTLSDTPWNYGR